MDDIQALSPLPLDFPGDWGPQPATVLEWKSPDQSPKPHTSILIKWRSTKGIMVIPAYYDCDPLTSAWGYFTHYNENRPVDEVDVRYIMGWTYQPFQAHE